MKNQFAIYIGVLTLYCRLTWLRIACENVRAQQQYRKTHFQENRTRTTTLPWGCLRRKQSYTMSKERSGRGFDRIAAVVMKTSGDLEWIKKQGCTEMNVWIFVQHVSIHVARIVLWKTISRASKSSAKSIDWNSEHDTFVRSSAKANENAKSIHSSLRQNFPRYKKKRMRCELRKRVSEKE